MYLIIIIRSITLKTKGPQFDNFVVTGGNISCHNDIVVVTYIWFHDVEALWLDSTNECSSRAYIPKKDPY